MIKVVGNDKENGFFLRSVCEIRFILQRGEELKIVLEEVKYTGPQARAMW